MISPSALQRLFTNAQIIEVRPGEDAPDVKSGRPIIVLRKAVISHDDEVSAALDQEPPASSFADVELHAAELQHGLHLEVAEDLPAELAALIPWLVDNHQELKPIHGDNPSPRPKFR